MKRIVDKIVGCAVIRLVIDWDTIYRDGILFGM